MHIRITRLAGTADDAMSEVERQSGLISAYVLRPMDQQQPILVTVWQAAEDAELAEITAGGQDFVSAGYEAADAEPGQFPAYGQLVYFDGPRTQAEAEAIERANRERIGPAVRSIPGNIGAFVGRNPDGSFVVLALTTSLQAIEDLQRVVMSTQLLPGEDPAQLTGPQRIQLAWVLAASSRTAPIHA